MNNANEIIENDIEEIISHITLDSLNGMDVLITGASGMIGTYLLFTLKRFVESGNQIKKLHIILHNDLPKHLVEFADLDWVNFIKGDLSDPQIFTKIPMVDIIIHAAGYAQPGKFTANPDITLRLNTMATFYLFDKLRKNGKFLFISTSEVYSGSSNIPYKESDIGTTNTNHSRACYIEGKRCGEAICNAYRSKGIDAKSARVSLAYGPGTRGDDERALNSFIRKSFLGNFQLFDSGVSKRTYCYISDTVELLWRILIDGKDSLYNVGGHSHTTIFEIANIIAEHENVCVSIPHSEGGLSGAPADVYLDMSKAECEFGKNHYVDLQTGIERTIEWNKKNYG